MKLPPSSGWGLSSEPVDSASVQERMGKNELGSGLSPPIVPMGQVKRKQRQTQPETIALELQNKSTVLRK